MVFATRHLILPDPDCCCPPSNPRCPDGEASSPQSKLALLLQTENITARAMTATENDMKTPWPLSLLCLLVLSVLAYKPGHSATTSSGANAGTSLNQLSAAFTGGQVVHQVQLA